MVVKSMAYEYNDLSRIELIRRNWLLRESLYDLAIYDLSNYMRILIEILITLQLIFITIFPLFLGKNNDSLVLVFAVRDFTSSGRTF